jgi:hypothetical protein
VLVVSEACDREPDPLIRLRERRATICEGQSVGALRVRSAHDRQPRHRFCGIRSGAPGKSPVQVIEYWPAASCYPLLAEDVDQCLLLRAQPAGDRMVFHVARSPLTSFSGWDSESRIAEFGDTLISHASGS